MKSLTPRALVVCAVAFFMTFWCLGKSIPGVGIGIFMIGVLLALYFSPILLLGSKIRLANASLYIAFVVIHILAIRPYSKYELVADFILHILVSVLFLIIIINIVNSIELYDLMITVLKMSTFILLLYLIYIHLVVSKSIFLSPSLSGSELYYSGRGGKNTLSFFLAIMFPFIYSKFTHRKSMLNCLMLCVFTFSILYTLSRMAMISMAVSVILFCILGNNRAAYIKQTIILGIVGLMLSIALGGGMKLFLQLRNPTEVEAVERGDESFISFKGHRYELIMAGLRGFVNHPVIGNGVTNFRIYNDLGRSLSHNDYIQILYELGAVGIILFLAIFIKLWRGMLAIKKHVPKHHHWLWDANAVALPTTALMLLFINAYETIAVWFVLAGCHVLIQCTSGAMSKRSNIPQING